MDRRLLVESNPCATRVALLEGDRLLELQVEPEGAAGHVGEIRKARVSRVVPAIDAAFVDLGLERDAFLFVDDVARPAVEEGAAAPGIEALLRPGDEVLAQVVKDALPGKGARITTLIALPGRLLVLLPRGRGTAMSRRLGDEAERERLQALAEELVPPDMGVIVRTAAHGAGREQLAADLAALVAAWEAILDAATASRAPARLHADLPAALRVVRDRFEPSIGELWVDGEATFRRVRDFVAATAPELGDRLRLEAVEGELFERFGVERQIEAALEARVTLPSGGHLVIQPTEALVAIDVNSGSSLASGSLATTALETNLEAASEVARQLRLRDLAGIIVVDFIDMEEAEHRRRVLERLAAELAGDPARSQLSEVSDFGLVAITRKRDRSNVYRRLTRPCPECGGRGHVPSLTAVGAAIWRRTLGAARRRPGAAVALRLHPELLAAIAAGSPLLAALGERLGERLVVAADDRLERGGWTVAAGDEVR